MKFLTMLVAVALAASTAVFAQTTTGEDEKTTRPGTYYAAPSGKVISHDAETTQSEDRETTAGDVMTTSGASSVITTGTMGLLPDAG